MSQVILPHKHYLLTCHLYRLFRSSHHLSEREELQLSIRAPVNSSTGLAAIINGTGSASSGSSSTNTNTTTANGTKCEMLGRISSNQQVSWSGQYIQTCCTTMVDATCFLRSNDDGSGSPTIKADPNACYQVPPCSDLLGGDLNAMAGFKPLSSTWGKGTQKNHYMFSLKDSASPTLIKSVSIAAVMISLGVTLALA